MSHNHCVLALPRLTHYVPSKYLRLPDGGTLGVDFTPPLSIKLDPSTPVIVVEHGLTGGEKLLKNGETSFDTFPKDLTSLTCVTFWPLHAHQRRAEVLGTELQ